MADKLSEGSPPNDLMAGYSGMQKPLSRLNRTGSKGWIVGTGLLSASALAVVWFVGGFDTLHSLVVEAKPYKAWAICKGTLGKVGSTHEELIITKVRYGYDREDDYQEAAKDISSNWKEYFRRTIFDQRDKAVHDVAGCCTCWNRAEELSWKYDPEFSFTGARPSKTLIIGYERAGPALEFLSLEDKTIREIKSNGER